MGGSVLYKWYGRREADGCRREQIRNSKIEIRRGRERIVAYLNMNLSAKPSAPDNSIFEFLIFHNMFMFK